MLSTQLTNLCSSCSGSGLQKVLNLVRCDYCSGRGKVRTNQGFFTVQQTCPQCSGYGEMIGMIHVINAVVMEKFKQMKMLL